MCSTFTLLGRGMGGSRGLDRGAGSRKKGPSSRPVKLADSQDAQKSKNSFDGLQFFEEFASGARDIDAAGDVAVPVLNAFYDARRFATLRAIRALGSVHHFLAISGLGDLGHRSQLSFIGGNSNFT